MPYAHPTVEHYTPLFVTLGAADRPRGARRAARSTASGWGCRSGRCRSPDRAPAAPDAAGRMMAVSILSIQSLVAYGHAGNSAAVFPLQRLGQEVWPVHDGALLQPHRVRRRGAGRCSPADDVAEVIRGRRGPRRARRCEAVLSGYQGAEDVGAVILDAVARVKAANPAALYCCDPVMGDVGRGMFVRPGIPEFMRDRVVPAADVVTPEPLRARLPRRHDVDARSTALLDAVDRVRADRPVRRAGDQRDPRRHPGRLPRPGRGLRRGRLADPYAAAARSARTAPGT